MNIKDININCEGSNDKFRYYYTENPDVYKYTGFGDLNEWYPDFFKSGCVDNSNIDLFYSRPSGDYTLEWMVERPSGTTTGIDYFTVTEGDTLTYILEY